MRFGKAGPSFNFSQVLTSLVSYLSSQLCHATHSFPASLLMGIWLPGDSLGNQGVSSILESAVKGDNSLGVRQRLESRRGLSLMFLDAQAGEWYKADITLVISPYFASLFDELPQVLKTRLR